ARDAGPEWEAGRSEALGPGQCAPAAHVQAEEGADEDGVAGAQPQPPHDAGMGVGYPAPVVPADSKRRWATGRAAGAVDPGDLRWLDAEVRSERRVLALIGPQIGLGDDRELRQVVERAQAVRSYP